jgi:hypothetical protein
LEENKMGHIIIKLDDALHKKLKLYAITNNIFMRDIIIETIKDRLKK